MTWSRLDEIKRLLSEGEPASAYIFPEKPGGEQFKKPRKNDSIFVFQYWPETVESAYTVNYGQKAVVGGSHDLQQWTGGSGRDVTFSAVFTAEKYTGRERAAAGDFRANTFIEDIAAGSSARYTVDVRGAVSYIQALMRGSYEHEGETRGLNSIARPPKKVWLVLENTGLGGKQDEVLTILRSAPVTYEAWFPDGKPRIVVMSLTFTEIVQRSVVKKGVSAIKFIGREVFEEDGDYYHYKGSVDRTLG